MSPGRHAKVPSFPSPELSRELLRQASRNNLSTMLVNLAATAVVWAIIEADAPGLITTWLTLMLAVLAVRGAAHWALSRALARNEDATRLAWVQQAGLLLSGALWAVLAWVRLPAEQLDHQMAILITVSALAGGAIGVLAPLVWTARLYISLLLLPACGALLVDGIAPMLGLSGVAFWVVMIFGHRGNHQLLVRSINLAHENLSLVDQLRARTAEVEDANRELENRVAARTSQLADMAARAESANRAKSAFLTTVSHEIRTPLNGIIGMSEVMQLGVLAPDQRGHLDVLQSSARSLNLILNDVIDISRIESGEMELIADEFDLHDLAAGLERVYAPLAGDKGLAFAVTVGGDVATLRWGDMPKLRQILSNLLSNALKFTREGRIDVDLRADGQDVVCAVRDTGVGVPAEKHAEVFERFVQADGSFARAAEGLGLGLSISRELARMMGGRIEIESAPGAGSLFRVTVPMPPVEVAPASTPREPEAQAPAGGGIPRVLVADDNAANRAVIQAMLGQSQVDVATVDGGAEAVAAWRAARWNLILMDIHMPQMDGLAATRAIRAAERAEGRPRTPIVAVTAAGGAGQLETYREAGMDGLVEKPVSLAALLEAVQAHVGPPQPSLGAAPLASRGLSL